MLVMQFCIKKPQKKTDGKYLNSKPKIKKMKKRNSHQDSLAGWLAKQQSTCKEFRQQ